LLRAYPPSLVPLITLLHAHSRSCQTVRCNLANVVPEPPAVYCWVPMAYPDHLQRHYSSPLKELCNVVGPPPCPGERCQITEPFRAAHGSWASLSVCFEHSYLGFRQALQDARLTPATFDHFNGAHPAKIIALFRYHIQVPDVEIAGERGGALPNLDATVATACAISAMYMDVPPFPASIFLAYAYGVSLHNHQLRSAPTLSGPYILILDRTTLMT
jgi:hypothetical protein